MVIAYFVIMTVLFFYCEYYLVKNKEKVLNWLSINDAEAYDAIVMPQVMILLVILAYPFIIGIIAFVMFGNLIKKMFEKIVKL